MDMEDRVLFTIEEEEEQGAHEPMLTSVLCNEQDEDVKEIVLFSQDSKMDKACGLGEKANDTCAVRNVKSGVSRLPGLLLCITLFAMLVVIVIFISTRKAVTEHFACQDRTRVTPPTAAVAIPVQFTTASAVCKANSTAHWLGANRDLMTPGP